MLTRAMGLRHVFELGGGEGHHDGLGALGALERESTGSGNFGSIGLGPQFNSLTAGATLSARPPCSDTEVPFSPPCAADAAPDTPVVPSPLSRVGEHRCPAADAVRELTGSV
eukprot:scaffold38892_cov32-Tisochrysis_lutea.AAC.4